MVHVERLSILTWMDSHTTQKPVGQSHLALDLSFELCGLPCPSEESVLIHFVCFHFHLWLFLYASHGITVEKSSSWCNSIELIKFISSMFHTSKIDPNMNCTFPGGLGSSPRCTPFKIISRGKHITAAFFWPTLCRWHYIHTYKHSVNINQVILKVEYSI